MLAFRGNCFPPPVKGRENKIGDGQTQHGEPSNKKGFGIAVCSKGKGQRLALSRWDRRGGGTRPLGDGPLTLRRGFDGRAGPPLSQMRLREGEE